MLKSMHTAAHESVWDDGEADQKVALSQIYIITATCLCYIYRLRTVS